MRVTLIHNPAAGDHSRPGSRGLLALMRAAGHQVRYQSSKKGHLASVLSESADLVAVAGGDGTIAKVARLMRGRETPIALLPIGTANNISTALGTSGLTLAQHVAGWDNGRVIAFDIGRARGPWGSRRFVESFGLGLMPEMMTASDGSAGRRLEGADAKKARALRSALVALHLLPAFEVKATLDEQALNGRYVLLEAMNIGLVGPNLELATRADPTDGQLDIVAVREEDRDLLAECIRAEQRGASWPHKLPVLRGNKLRIARLRAATHVDDEVTERRRDGSGDRSVELSIEDRVAIMLPQ